MSMGALDAYGYRAGPPSTPGGAAIVAETQIGQGHELSAAVMGKMPFGVDNPLFWLLVLFLVFTGWIYLGGSFGIKRIGSISAKVGK